MSHLKSASGFVWTHNSKIISMRFVVSSLSYYGMQWILNIYLSLVGLQTFRHADFQQTDGNTVQYTTSSLLLWHCFILYLTLHSSPHLRKLRRINSGKYILSHSNCCFILCLTESVMIHVYVEQLCHALLSPHKPCRYLYLYLVCYHASYWSLHLCSSLQSVNCNYHLAVQKYPHKPCGVEHLRLQRVFQPSVCEHTSESLLRASKIHLCSTVCIPAQVLLFKAFLGLLWQISAIKFWGK